jgi:hypothetical protein
MVRLIIAAIHTGLAEMILIGGINGLILIRFFITSALYTHRSILQFILPTQQDLFRHLVFM